LEGGRGDVEGGGGQKVKWYHWAFIFVMQVFVSVLVLFLFISQIKVVSFMEVSAMGVEDIVKALQSGQSPEEIQKVQMEKIRSIEQKLKNERGIVLLKECVIKGPFKDITNEVVP